MMRTPSEFAHLRRVHSNNLVERKRLLEDEKMIPFKKRNVRFGKDGFRDLSPSSKAESEEFQEKEKPIEVEDWQRECTLRVAQASSPESGYDEIKIENEDDEEEEVKDEEDPYEKMKKVRVLLSKKDQEKAMQMEISASIMALDPKRWHLWKPLKKIIIEPFDPYKNASIKNDTSSPEKSEVEKPEPKKTLKLLDFF